MEGTAGKGEEKREKGRKGGRGIPEREVGEKRKVRHSDKGKQARRQKKKGVREAKRE